MARYVESGATVTGQGERRKHAASEACDAGLVLLYAAEYESFPRTVPFSGVTLVGRSPPAGVTLPQEAISRVHARFWQKGDAWFVADLNSRNGTRVGGRTVTEVRLAPRDEVQIGDALFAFVPSGLSEHSRFRIDGFVEGDEGVSLVPELVGGLVVRRIAEEARSVAATGLSVLVEGETGTGKEILARAIHRLSGADGALAVLRCADVSPSALTLDAGGVRRTTILLDQVGDLPPESQATLLRMLTTASAPRVIAATHHDLGELVKAGRFRADLFARLSGCRIRMPPLRERKEDIYALVRHACSRAGASIPGDRDVSFGFMRGLVAYSWPFNVRELENVVQWALATAEGRTLTKLPESIERALEEQTTPPQAPEARDGERRAGALSAPDVRALLQKHGGNVSAVARELGKDRAQLHRWMRDRDIDPEDYRRG